MMLIVMAIYTMIVVLVCLWMFRRRAVQLQPALTLKSKLKDHETTRDDCNDKDDAGSGSDSPVKAAAPANVRLRGQARAFGGTPLQSLAAYSAHAGTKLHIDVGCRHLVGCTARPPRAWTFCATCCDGRVASVASVDGKDG